MRLLKWFRSRQRVLWQLTSCIKHLTQNCRTICRQFQLKWPRHDSTHDAKPSASDTDTQSAMAEYAMYFGDDLLGRFIADSMRTQ